jgi:hypothetical protein
MVVRAMGIAWFRAEDYQRIREISDDEMLPTFEEFEARMAARMPQIAAQLGSGIILEKVTIEPDELLAFAREHHSGKINSHVRSEFAARVMAQKHGTDH